MKTRLFALILVVVMSFLAFNFKTEASIQYPYSNYSNSASCNFTRSLYIGTWGEDVRCLQAYLTSYGITMITADGYYGPVTAQAVARWQAGNSLAPNGSFDSQSRARYNQMFGGGRSGSGPGPIGTNESQALERINNALVMVQNADEVVDDARGNNSKAKNLLKEAKADILSAVKAFYEGNFSKAMDLAADAYDNAQDAFYRVDGNNNSSNDDIDDIEDLIDEVQENIDDAEDEIDDARDDGADVDEAEDLLDEARDLLDEALDEFDDGDYDDAEELAEDADDLVDDALDAIDEDDNNNNIDRNDALNKIEDAEDEIDDARDEIEEADDDGADVDDAEDILDDAEDAYDDALIEFNQGDYDEAYDFADEAIELAEDAVDAID